MVLQTEVFNGGYKQHAYSSYQGPIGGYNNYSSEFTSPYSSPFQVPSHGPYHQSSWSGGSDCYGSEAGHYAGGGIVAPVKTTPHGNSYAHLGSNSHVSAYQLQVHGSPNHHGHESPKHHASHGSPHNQGHGSPDQGQGHGGVYNQGHASHPGQGYGSPNGQGYASHHDQGYGSSHGQGHGDLHNQSHGRPQAQGHESEFGFGKAQTLGGAITNQISKLTHGRTNYGGGSPNYGYPSSGFNHGYKQQPTWTVKSLDDDE